MRLLHEPDRARRAGLVLAAASAVAAVTGLAFFLAAGARLADSWMPHNLVGSLALAGAFTAMVRRQPHNAAVWTLGWAMIVQAFGQALVIGLGEFARVRVASEGVEPGATYDALPTWLAWMTASTSITWILGVVPLVTLALQLFPDGRLPSRRWRPLVALTFLAMLTFASAIAVASRPRPGLVIGEIGETAISGVVLGIGALLLFSAVLGSIASLVLRYRRSAGIERRQIRWIAAGGTVFGLSMFVWLVAVHDLALAQRVFWLVSIVTFPLLMGSYAVAILRYRLYDIDVVISRSLVVAALAGFIATVYVAVVVGVGTLVGVGDEANLGLKVVATAIVAVAFQPLRQRVRRWADRLVYGQRATPYEVLAQFSRQAANAGDDANLQRIADVLAAGTGAAPATVWLRVGDHIRPAASSDAAAGPEPVPLLGGDLPELPAPLVVPVRHDGELLGAVSLAKPRSEPPTPQDEELAVRLARGLGLVLRNARLTAELRAHLEALEASRSRLVRAQDDARRKIEGELRDGAQSQLVELKALLGLARGRSADADAVKTAALLEQLEREADDAVDTLRGLAQGIYPPVLEAEGLAAAVRAQAGKSTLPVTAHATGLPRHPPEVEAAVYFCVLEALQNAAKYAQASSVHVGLEQRHDGLWFEVSDDGLGFDPLQTTHGSGLKGIAARLDTVGGTLEVRSAPGAGTRVIGHVPVTPPLPVGSPALEVPA